MGRTLALKSDLCVSRVDRTSDHCHCMFSRHETNSTAKNQGLCTLILTASQFFAFREVTERMTILLHASRFEATVYMLQGVSGRHSLEDDEVLQRG